jgi:hypothetical protein
MSLDTTRDAPVPDVLADMAVCYQLRVELTLIYEGPLPPKGRGISPVKATLREAFHPQIKTQVEPRLGKNRRNIMTSFMGQQFFSPAHPGLRTAAELHVLMLTPVVDRRPGDVDNRLKTLVDGLTRPANPQQMSNFTPPDPAGTFCLLDDDARVTRITLDTRNSYRPPRASKEVLVVVTAKIVLGADADMSSPTGNLFLVL